MIRLVLVAQQSLFLKSNWTSLQIGLPYKSLRFVIFHRRTFKMGAILKALFTLNRGDGTYTSSEGVRREFGGRYAHRDWSPVAKHASLH